jgi:hypothetical protein
MCAERQKLKYLRKHREAKPGGLEVDRVEKRWTSMDDMSPPSKPENPRAKAYRAVIPHFWIVKT